MTPVYQIIEKEFKEKSNREDAGILQRFFKTGKGEYGEGDLFLGIRVPVTREIVKKYRKRASLMDIEKLINSKYHEIRLAGFLLLIELFKQNRKNRIQTEIILQFYIDNIAKGNNWDLVDLVAPKILGEYLIVNKNKRYILKELASMNESLWHQRVAIVSTWTLIRNREFDEAFELSKLYLNHKHDLIHKASGWMLREIGKRGGMGQLLYFLEENAESMPRTMLRYAIEKLSDEQRIYFLTKGKN